jgi:hypothetical protein
MFRDICRGLEHAHERKLVHRDLKPSNVMFTTTGMLKITDFGLARRLDSDISLTTAGQVLGSRPYMSPEQARGERTGQQSDIFSLGILGYELLGGERPFRGQTESEVLRQIQEDEPPELGSLNPLVPAEIVRTIHQMLAKAPERRIQTVAEVTARVEEALETLAVRRDRALLREYAREPDAVSVRLRNERSNSEVTERDTPSTVTNEKKKNVGAWKRMLTAAIAVLALVIVAYVAWQAARQWFRVPMGNGAPEQVQLAVESDPPGASLWVNKEAAGTTPCRIFGVEGDSVEIELDKADFERFSTRLILRAGMGALRIGLAPLPSLNYSISTSPGNAEVYVDDAPGPLTWPMKAQLMVGTHRLLVRYGGGEREFTYEVRSGDAARILVLHYDTGRLEAKP